MEGRRPNVVVLGSVHMDLIATAERLPGPGESVAGGAFAMAPGGKGGNQALQLALAGAEVKMLSRLGEDPFGRELLSALQAKGVDTSLVAVDEEHPTGASTVFAAQGDYCSIIAPGAAARLSTDDVERARSAIEAADALVLQLELPPQISDCAAEIAAGKGRAVILNASPAPAQWSEAPDSLWRATTILVVNRVEAGRLLGRDIQPEGLDRAVRELAGRYGIKTVLVNLGPQGTAALHAGAFLLQPAYPAEVVDAVGAGDAFLGVSCAALLEGLALQEALRRGAAAGALAVSRRGVYEALPTRSEVYMFLEKLAA